jgi:hypothetical protein
MPQSGFREAPTTLPVAPPARVSRLGITPSRTGLKRSDPKEKAKRAALNALRRARRAAENAKISLSDWEGEFLGSVEGRVETYGRAFGDPEKGAPGASLSVLQSQKLKEIEAKARGKTLSNSSFRRKRPEV